MTARTFTPPTLAELGRIRRYLGITPLEAEQFVPAENLAALECDEGEKFEYASYVKEVYGKFLLRRLIEKISSPKPTQTRAPAQPSKVPTMSELHVMRIKVGLGQAEALILFIVCAIVGVTQVMVGKRGEVEA